MTSPASRAPILFVHGQDDDYVPPQMAQRLYDAKVQRICGACTLPRMPRTLSRSGRTRSTYDQILGTFLEDAGLIAERAYPTQPEQAR